MENANEDAAAARRKRQREGDQLQASARRQVSEDGFEDSWDNESQAREGERARAPRPTPTPSATQTVAAARQKSALQRQQNARTQSRTQWSDHDTELLVSMIEEVGCSWALIAKTAEFEDGKRNEDQVGLKDKARNLKVAYLK
jgi:hypothetical protein